MRAPYWLKTGSRETLRRKPADQRQGNEAVVVVVDGEINSDSAKLFGAGNAELAAPRAVAISFYS